MIPTNIPIGTSISAVKAKVDVQTASTLVTCTCGDYLQEFVLHREGDTSKFFGFGISHKLDVTFIDLDRKLANASVKQGNTVKVALGDGTNFDYPYPTLYITELSRNEKSSNITCAAYDLLYQANYITVSEVNISYPITVRDMIRKCAEALGLSFAETSGIPTTLLETQFTEALNFNGDEPLRTLLDALAEFTQSIYHVKRISDTADRLVFKQLSKDGDPVLTVDKEMYFELTTLTPRTLTGLCHATELGDNLNTPDESGVVQIMRDNPLYSMNPNTPTLLNEAAERMSGFTIHQLDCEWDGNHCLEIGDKVAFVTEDDSTVFTYIINDVIEYQGFVNEITSWEYTQEDSTASNPTNIGDKINQTIARVDKVNKEITLMATDVTETKTELAELKLTTDDIALSVEATTTTLKEYTDYAVSDVKEIVNAETAKTQSALTAVTTAVDELQTQTNESFVVINEKVSKLELTDSEIRASVSAVEQSNTNRVDSLSSEITALTKEVNLKLTSEDVTIAINKSLTEGVDKVVTSTKKYTFDDTGLNVGSSDSSISTTITEDGMRINRAGQEVLRADNEGVKAEDLHATTYLIIGENSRLEDWQNRYTACFWLGGK